MICVSENDRAFDILYCIAFKLMDQQWLAMHASYMDFNVRHVLSTTELPILSYDYMVFYLP